MFKKPARDIVSRASCQRRRRRDSLVTRAVYLLAISCASLKIAQKLFESCNALHSQSCTLTLRTYKNALAGAVVVCAESKGFEPLMGYKPIPR